MQAYIYLFKIIKGIKDMITIQNMKTPGKIFALVFCTLIAVPAYSSSISYTDDSYTTGDTLTAADLNTKFNEIKADVNDNDDRVTTNEGDITTNEGDITTNAGDIVTNAADITALQAANTCPSGMTAVGNSTLCVDIFEASIWDAATAGTQYLGANPFTAGTMNIPCLANGSDCVDGGANPIYARSVTGVQPAYELTYHQAAVACANVSKRLPTVAEWQLAAVGTPSGNGGLIAGDCNNTNGGGALRNTGIATSCVSAAGAFDMVGNLYEMTADVHFGTATAGTNDTIDNMYVVAFGDDYADFGNTNSVNDSFILATNQAATNYTTGFRCVK